MINGKVEDRICGWGPTLIYYLSVDEDLHASRNEFFNYFETNYNAALLYLERFKFILDFFAEDSAVAEDDIKNETGWRELIKILLFILIFN